MDIQDFGLVKADLLPLIKLVGDLPHSIWDKRSDRESKDTLVLRKGNPYGKEIETEIRKILDQVQFKPGYTNREVLSLVPAYKEILGHFDDFGDQVRKTSIHCHIPLITDESIIMGFGKENSREYHLKKGHLYYMNETEWHYVKNPTSVDRVHLLFAYFPHDQSIENITGAY